MGANINASDVDLLIQWEFLLFKQFSMHKDEQDFTAALNSLISLQQFQLISKLMSNEGRFNSQEMVELFQLGDKFLVAGQTKEKIFSLFMSQLSSEEVNICELPYLNLWNEFVNCLKCNPAIEIVKYSIKLDGLKVSLENKEDTLVLFKNLAKSYKVLHICDIPLRSDDLKAIHPNLTELHIKRCPFNFEEQLDLSQSTHLTHFTCSECFADCHLLFALESLTSSLEYLDISDNWLNPADHSPLVTWIEKQKSLKHLNLSNNNLNPRSAPTLFNVLFNHPSLEVLNLTKNYLFFEFLEQLSSFSGTPNWKSLAINDSDQLVNNTYLFSICFPKLNQLEYLDMSDASDNCEQVFTSSLCDGLLELTNLREFVSNSKTDRDLSKEIKK